MTNWRGPGTTGRTVAPRLRVRRWRDPRLLLGVLLVLGATVLGARLAAASDDTVEYWSVATDVVPGDAVSDRVLEPTRVRLTGAAADQYLRTDDELAASLDELVWDHALPAGALVSKDVLVHRAIADRGQLPLSVSEGSAPVDLARGDLVDVWVGPGPGDTSGREAVRVLDAVRVAGAGGDDAVVGGAGRTVLVDVDAARLEAPVVTTIASGHVTLVRVS